MPIEDRNLKAGTKLVARYHKQAYTCEVVEVEGKLKFRLQDGREFKSPSAAGMAITGKSCNGWAFWSVAKAENAAAAEPPQVQASQPEQAASAAEATPAAQPTAALAGQEAQQAAAEPKQEAAPAKSPFFKLPNQKGAPEGQVRWYCRECKQGFLAPAGTTPEACPRGHKAS